MPQTWIAGTTTMLEALRDAAQTHSVAGNELQALALQAAVEALAGYGSWKQGQPEEAIRQLEGVPLRYRGPVQRWWLGQLYLEADRPADALRFFNTYWFFRWSHSLYYLGLAHERMDQRNEAEAAYVEFIEAWEGAHSALQPFVEEASERLAVVSGVRSTTSP